MLIFVNIPYYEGNSNSNSTQKHFLSKSINYMLRHLGKLFKIQLLNPKLHKKIKKEKTTLYKNKSADGHVKKTEDRAIKAMCPVRLT